MSFKSEVNVSTCFSNEADIVKITQLSDIPVGSFGTLSPPVSMGKDSESYESVFIYFLLVSPSFRRSVTVRSRPVFLNDDK